MSVKLYSRRKNNGAKGRDQLYTIRKQWWKCGTDRPYAFLIKRLIKKPYINNANMMWLRILPY